MTQRFVEDMEIAIDRINEARIRIDHARAQVEGAARFDIYRVFPSFHGRDDGILNGAMVLWDVKGL